MSRSELAILLAALSPIFAGTLRAQDSGTDKPPVLRVASTNEFIPHLDPITRVYVVVGTNKFAMIVPPGYRMSDANLQKVTFVNEDFSCYLTFQVVRRALPDVQELNPDDYRPAALEEHPGATLKQEFTVGALGGRGPAFDISWTGAGGVGRSERVVFIRSENWIVEFTMLANSDRFPGGAGAFSSLLLNFRASRGGKLVLNQISDRI